MAERKILKLKQVQPIVDANGAGKPAAPDVRKPLPPIRDMVREFQMPNGRKLLIHKFTLTFLAEADSDQFDGQTVTIVGLKPPAKPCPVLADFEDVKAWWVSR